MSRAERRALQGCGGLAFLAAEASLHLWNSHILALYSVFMILATCAGTAIHMVAAVRGVGHARRVWSITALGLAFWAFAEVSVGIEAILTGSTPGRSILANVFNLGALLLAVVAMLMIPSAPKSTSGKLCMALDGLVAASALLGIVWIVALEPMIHLEGSKNALFDLAYPVLTVGVLTVALVLLAGQSTRQANAMTAITAGVCVLATALLVEIATLVVREDGLRPWIWGGYVASAVLLGMAPLAPLPHDRQRTWQPSTALGSVIPYLPLAGFVLICVCFTLTGRALDPQVVWAIVLMLGAILGRQSLALQLNVALTRDLAAQRERLALEALHDPLTGLPNRALLTSTLADLDPSPTGQDSTALLMIDLDGFKAVNDTLSHAAGDQLLITIADRLREAIAPYGQNAFAARLGGDEFAVLLHPGALETATDLARDILRRFAEPMVFDDRPATVRASIGIALTSQRPATARLLHHADLALYEAKHHAKGHYQLFDRRMADAVKARRSLQTDLAKALADGQFSLAYQPIVDLSTGASHSAEALVRWNHPREGTLGPDAFLPVAADGGLLADVDRWVLSTAASQLAAWREADPEYTMNVNMSAAYLACGTVVEDVHRALHDHRLPADALVIEVTEDSLIANLDEAARTLGKLRDLGVRVALDDFGVGYSSLTYLRRLPVNVVKIDRSFIGDLDRDPPAAVLVGNVLSLVHGLGLSCIAEGIENPRQIVHLRTCHCEQAQGFLFSRPRFPDALDSLPPGVASVPSEVRAGRSHS